MLNSLVVDGGDFLLQLFLRCGKVTLMEVTFSSLVPLLQKVKLKIIETSKSKN